MNRPEISLQAQRAEQQPGAFGQMALTLMGQAGAEIWHVTVTCPHGSSTAVVSVAPNGKCGLGHDHAAMSANELTHHTAEAACEIVRSAHFKQAPCACSDPFWMQQGPVYDLSVHIGNDQAVGHGKLDCFSAN